MWDFKTIITDFIKTRNIQEFINNRFLSASKMVIVKNHFKFVGTDYAMFNIGESLFTIHQVDTEYNYDDFRSSDIVLDIGANIGAFSLKVCKNVKHVYAVEPVTTSALRDNIMLNKTKNITVVECGLGRGVHKIKWLDQSKTINCAPLSKLIEMCGGKVDIIKCDCEGGEWCIQPNELKGVRRIEMELHLFNNENKNEFLGVLDQAGYNYEIDEMPNAKTLQIHAYMK